MVKKMEIGPRVHVEDIDFTELFERYETLGLKELIEEYIAKRQEVAELLDVYPPTEQSALAVLRNSKEIEFLAERILDENIELYKAGLII